MSPQSRLVAGIVLIIDPPGCAVLDRTDWLLPMIGEFLDAPMPETERAPGGSA
jgi:hypothetical protein